MNQKHKHKHTQHFTGRIDGHGVVSLYFSDLREKYVLVCLDDAHRTQRDFIPDGVVDASLGIVYFNDDATFALLMFMML